MKKIILIFCLIISGFILVYSQPDTFPGYALSFDGSDDYVDCGNDASLQRNGPTALTIEAWVKPTGGVWCALVSKFVHTASVEGYSLEIFSDNRVAFLYGNNWSDWNATTSSVALQPNIWSHVAATYDGSTVKIYVNGVQTASATWTNGITDSGTNLVIGQRAGTTFYTGAIDEVRIWNVARTEADIKANMCVPVATSTTGLNAYWQFNEGSGTALSDEKNISNGTLTNMTVPACWIESYALVAPVAKTATNIATDTCTAHWSAPVTGVVDNYFLEVATNNTFTSYVSGYNPKTVAVTDTSISITGLSANTTYYYRVRANKTSVTGQGAYSNTMTLTTLPAQPSVITGASIPCSGATGLSYNVAGVSGLTYSWSVPSGWTITGGDGTNTITVTAGSLSGNITVTPSNSSGTGISRSLSVSTKTVPAQPSISGISNPCEGISFSLINTITDTSATFTWSVPSDWTINSGNGNDSIFLTAGSLSGNIIVIPSNVCGNGVADTLAVSPISRVPVSVSVDISPASEVCEGTSVTFSTTGINEGMGPIYEWYVNGSFSDTGRTYTPVSIQNGDEIYVLLTSTALCVISSTAISDTTHIFVHPNPAAPVITINTLTSGNPSLQSSYTTGNQWYDTTGLITGETGQVFTPLTSDDYYVVYTDGNGCVSVSDTLSTYVGIAEHNTLSFSVYPNPVSDIFIIRTTISNMTNCTMSIYNTLGERVRSEHITQNEQQINVKDLRTGIYMIEIRSNQRSEKQKLIIQ